MIVNYERRGFVDEPYLRVHQEHGLSMQLRQGSMEVGLQRSAIRLVSLPAGEIGLCAPDIERWIGSADIFRVLDVAIACGFKTQQHFARVFRQLSGFSPTEYRHEFIS